MSARQDCAPAVRAAEARGFSRADDGATLPRTPAERKRFWMLVSAGVPIGIAADLVTWKARHPDEHLGGWGSHVLARILCEAKAKAAQ